MRQLELELECFARARKSNRRFTQGSIHHRAAEQWCAGKSALPSERARLFHMCWHGLPCLKWEQDEDLERVDGHRHLTWCEQKSCLSISEHRICLVDGIKSAHTCVEYTMLYRTTGNTRLLQISCTLHSACAPQVYEFWVYVNYATLNQTQFNVHEQCSIAPLPLVCTHKWQHLYVQ